MQVEIKIDYACNGCLVIYSERSIFQNIFCSLHNNLALSILCHQKNRSAVEQQTKRTITYAADWLPFRISRQRGTKSRKTAGRIFQISALKNRFLLRNRSHFFVLLQQVCWCRYFSLVARPPRMCLSDLLMSRTFLASTASAGFIWDRRSVTSLCMVVTI